MIKNKNTYYLLAFIEGSCVMATELLGAKMLAPFFGSSLYVWSSVLAITLGGLALGYFLGGIISYKYPKPNNLLYILLLGAAFNILMPFSSRFILNAIGYYSLIPAVIFSAVFFLLPPVLLMGMVSPILVSKITSDSNNSGKVAGSVYAISTLGGIISTFLTGFYIIPNYGLTIPAIVNGILLGFIPLFFLIKSNKIWLLFLCFFSMFIYVMAKPKKAYPDVKIRYQAEGLLGQVIVADQPVYTKNFSIENYNRFLYVNHVAQSMINLKTGDILEYIKKVMEIIPKSDSPNKTALLLGLGGGTLANELSAAGYKVDACELDERIAHVAKKFFFLKNNIHVSIDDARHFIKNTTKKYDLVLFDVFKGEENPSHVFTLESLEELKKNLNENALILVNNNGFLNTSAGLGTQSIYKTLTQSGFNVQLMPSNNNTEERRNLLFIASLKEKNLPICQNCLSVQANDLQNAVVLKDEYPILEILNKEAAKAWRSGYINHLIPEFTKRNIPLFN